MTGSDEGLLGVLTARLIEAAGLGMFGPGMHVLTEPGAATHPPVMTVKQLGDGVFQIDTHLDVGRWDDRLILNSQIQMAVETLDEFKMAASSVMSREHTVVFVRLERAHAP